MTKRATSSSTGASGNAVLTLPRLVERRNRVRFDMRLLVRYQTLERRSSSGIGWTVNISSGGVLVACEQAIPVGIRAELDIYWPTASNDGSPLHLLTAGRIVRCGSFGFAVVSYRWRFQTAGTAALTPDGSDGEFAFLI